MPSGERGTGIEDAVVVGGGVAGLAAALALARRGASVTVVERDALDDEPATPDEAFARRRQGVPQLHHSHAFLARLRNLLRDRTPDLLSDLLSAGAAEIRFCDRLPAEMQDRDPRPGDDDLVALACRRTTFEWVLRRAVRAESGVTWRSASQVDGLLADDDGATPAVTGVTTRSGNGSPTKIPSRIVVDASGRFSPLPRWLEAIGAERPEESAHECGIIYSSRFYRLHPDVADPADDGRFGGDLGYMKYALFRGDDRTFSVTFGLPTDDPEMRPLLRAEPFDAAARSLPVTAAWVDPARCEPISDVAAMGRLKNRRRRLAVDGRPLANGIVALGDAAIHTNPLYGRGCALALVQAFALSDMVCGAGLHGEELSVAWSSLLASEVEPWYRASVAQDREDAARRQVPSHPSAGSPDPQASLPGDLVRDAVLPATRVDPVVYRAFVRGLNILDSPTELIQDAEVVSRVMAVWEARDRRPPPPAEGPSRTEMLGILAGRSA